MRRHEHEEWQIRKSPDDRPYCAACGAWLDDEEESK